MTSFLNRCMWTPAGSGTSDFVVRAAVENGYTPAQCSNPTVTDGETYHYIATQGANHEEGDGAYTVSTTTLARTTIRNSSNGGATVSFSSPPTVIMGGPTASDSGAVDDGTF